LYVRRLAAVYGVRYETFCLRALGIPRADWKARGFRSPSPIILQRLSAGTGVPVEVLADMTPARSWARYKKESDTLGARSEGQVWSDAILERAGWRRRPRLSWPAFPQGGATGG
jgi:hypothetical protein